MKTLAVLSTLVVLFIATSPFAAMVMAAAPDDPPSEFSIADQGFGEQTLRGSSATSDMYFPGPGRYRIGEGNVFTLVLGHAEVLDPSFSTVTVFFNGSPVRTWFLIPETGQAREIPIYIASGAIRPDINHVMLRFTMRLPREACIDTEHPALIATVYRQTRIKYDLLLNLPLLPRESPDLGRFPLTLMEPSSIKPDRLAIVVPDDPSPLELRASLNVAAAVRRYAGARPVDMHLLRAGEAADELPEAHVIIIGRPRANNLWDTQELREIRSSIKLIDRDKGIFQYSEGVLVDENDGVVLDVSSPWNKDLRAVLLTGATEEAVLRTSLALGSDIARKELHGDEAVITKRPIEVAPPKSVSEGTLTDFTLANLGHSGRHVTGWGSHVLTVPFDTVGVPARGARAKIIYDHSRLVNPNVSALGVSLNGTPLTDAPLKADREGRSTLEVQLPANALHPGRNILSVRFNLAPQVGGGEVRLGRDNTERVLSCGVLPPDLAWGVLYSDSSIHLPPGTMGGASLGSFPFPFIREGKADNLLLVLPDDLAFIGRVPELASEFGRAITSNIVDLPVATAGRLNEKERHDSNLVVFGLAESNPLIAELNPWLPLRLERTGRLLQSPDGPLAGVRDDVSLGVIQIISSPFNPERSILVLSATTPHGLELALRGLGEGDLQGNLATVTPPEEGGSLLGIRTFDISVVSPETSPAFRAKEAAPVVFTVLVAVIVVGLLAGASMALTKTLRRMRSVDEEAEDLETVDDWMDGLNIPDRLNEEVSKKR